MNLRPLQPSDLRLRTRFAVEVRWEFSSYTDGMVRYFHRRLLQRGIRVSAALIGSDLVLAYELSIEDALALGYNQAGPGQLESALIASHPELAADPEGLRMRVEELARLYSWSQRIAS